jgi:hypothetical protein
MHRALDWVFIVLGLIWLATPWVLVPVAWRKWAKGRRKGNPLMEDLIDDPAFLIGQTLATISCCAFIPIYIFVAVRMDQPRHVLDSAVLLCFASACVAVLTLPFAVSRAKWLSFASSLLNASAIALVLFASME